MLGLYGIIRKNLEDKGIINVRLFSEKDRIYRKHTSTLFTESALIPGSIENGTDILYWLCGSSLRDFSQKNWSVEVKSNRSSIYTGSNYSYHQITFGSAAYSACIALNKKRIHTWWASNTQELYLNYSGTGNLWLKVAYDKDAKTISFYYATSENNWIQTKQLSSDLFTLKEMNFHIDTCSKDSTILVEDIKFKYGDDYLFGS